MKGRKAEIEGKSRMLHEVSHTTASLGKQESVLLFFYIHLCKNLCLLIQFNTVEMF